MWEIRENTGKYGKEEHSYKKDKSEKEAYECGFEDGYKAALEEMEEEEEEKISYRKRYR